MDEEPIKMEDKGIELADPLPNDGAGGSGTPQPEGVSSDISGQSGVVATLDEPEPSGPTVSSANDEPALTAADVAPESAPVEAAVEIQPPVPFEKFQEVLDAREKLYDRFLRKQAEFENFRKRIEKEKQEFYDFALSNFIKELLPVLDGLDRGLYAHEGETVESYKKGMELILKQFRDVLSSVGLQPIRAIGTIFDPNYHQAVMSEENSNLAENEIIEELQRGYTFKDRLLRPSMVKVAIQAASPASNESSPADALKSEDS